MGYLHIELVSFVAISPDLCTACCHHVSQLLLTRELIHLDNSHYWTVNTRRRVSGYKMLPVMGGYWCNKHEMRVRSCKIDDFPNSLVFPDYQHA